MSRVVTHSETITVYPTSYDTTDYSWYSSSNMGNGYGHSSNTVYATINDTRGSNAQTWCYFVFDTSSIPDNAAITSVSCTAKCVMNGSNAQVATRAMQMYSGTTAKGSAVTGLSTSTTERTLSVGTWTLSEIRNARLKVYATRGTSSVNTNYYIRFYGATLTISYSWDETLFTTTASTNSSSVIVSPASKEYSSGLDAKIYIQGNITRGSATDNNVDVTNLITGSGGSYSYSVSNISADHAFVLSVPDSGNEALIKLNGSWMPIDSIFIKQNGAWVNVDAIYTKQNDTWVGGGGGGVAPVVEPVFYDYLEFDGTAYIETDYVLPHDCSIAVAAGAESTKGSQQVFGATGGGGLIAFFLGGGSTTSNRQMVPYYDSASYLFTNRTLAFSYNTYTVFITPHRFGWGSASYIFTKGSLHPTDGLLLGKHNLASSMSPYTGRFGDFRIYGSSASGVTSASGFANYVPLATFRPCTYNGEAGMWFVEGSKFYGNSAGAGSLSVSNG